MAQVSFRCRVPGPSFPIIKEMVTGKHSTSTLANTISYHSFPTPLSTHERGKLVLLFAAFFTFLISFLLNTSPLLSILPVL